MGGGGAAVSAIVDYPRGAIVGPGRVVRYERPRFVPMMFANCVLWLNATRGVSTVDAAIVDGSNMAGAGWSRTNSPAVDAETIRDTLDGAPTAHWLTQPGTPAVTIGAWAVAVAEFKAGTKTWAYCAAPNGVIAYLNLATGTLGTVTGGTATVTSLAGGWWRLTLRGYCNSGQAAVIGPANGNGALVYQGNGTGTILCRTITLTQRMVGLWRDDSGAGNDFAQAVNADRVSLVADQYNGQPALRSGDQTDHLEHATSVSLGTAATIVLAHKQGSTANNYVTCDAAGANGIISRFSGGLLEWFNGSGADRYTLANTPAGLNVYTIRQTNGVALQAWRNGVSVFGPVVPAAALTNIKSLFGRFNATNGSSGEDFTEAVVYQRAVSDAERVRVERMVGMHWGVAVL